MPKKAAKKTAKKAAKKASTKLATPTGDQSTQPALHGSEIPSPPEPPKPLWRKVTKQEYLKVPFSESERNSFAQELARTVNEKGILEDEKKQMAKRIGEKIDALHGRQKELSGFIRDGFEERHITCEWMFQTSGKAGDEFIYHPEMKTLIRTDTGEVVEVRRITESDFNVYQELPVKDAAPELKEESTTTKGEGLPVAGAQPPGLALVPPIDDADAGRIPGPEDHGLDDEEEHDGGSPTPL